MNDHVTVADVIGSIMLSQSGAAESKLAGSMSFDSGGAPPAQDDEEMAF